MRHEIRARFPGRSGIVDDDLARQLEAVFHFKLGHTNAEDFLEFLDAATVADSPQARRLIEKRRDLATVVEALSTRARRIVAAECCAFLESNPVIVGTEREAKIRERWIPYATWAWNLTREDTIISFNYDRVLEKLTEEVSHSVSNGGPWSAPMPFRIVRTEDDLRMPSGVKVLKLHGSVDWLLGGRGSFSFRPGYPWLTDETLNLAIGTPGPGKLHTATGPFAWLWRAAENAIKLAEEVILVGYRFPESDGFARNTLLEALRDSRVERVRVVLGLNSPDAPRVSHLLDMAKPDKVQVQIRQLWSEDFLDQWRPD